MHLFSLVRRVRHGLTLGVRVIATDGQDRLVLVRHSYLPGWHLPGGGVDVGETAAAAAARELREEANVELTAPLELHGVFFNPRVGRRDHVVCFRAAGISAGPRPAAGLEILAAEFFSLDALPDETTPGTLRRIAEWRAGAPLGEFW